MQEQGKNCDLGKFSVLYDIQTFSLKQKRGCGFLYCLDLITNEEQFVIEVVKKSTKSLIGKDVLHILNLNWLVTLGSWWFIVMEVKLDL